MKKLVALGALLAAASGLILAQADPRQISLDAADATAASLARRLGPGHALVPNGVSTDALGQGHVRYQQTYRGVPVFEGEAIVHVDLNTRTVLDTTDATQGFGPIALRASLGENEAHGRAMEHFRMGAGQASRRNMLIMVDGGVASVT